MHVTHTAIYLRICPRLRVYDLHPGGGKILTARFVSLPERARSCAHGATYAEAVV